MTHPYPIAPRFDVLRPLLQGDQAIIDAIEQVEPGERGDANSDLVVRMQSPDRIAGRFGEVIVARTLNESGKQEFTHIDILPAGILVGIDTREPGSRERGTDWVQIPPSKLAKDANSPEAQVIKIEAARRIRLANQAAGGFGANPVTRAQ